MFQNFTIVDGLGVFGSILIAAAYLFVTRGWVDATRPTFNLINLFGALLILYSLYYRPNAGAILIELLWVAIAVYSLTMYFFRR